MASFLQSALAPVDKAAQILKLPKEVVSRLKQPEQSHEAKLLGKFPAWRVQWNNALGPYKGGIRYSPNANLDEVSALSALMTWKNSLLGLPLGGGKGAIQVDPRMFSEAELERLSRAYVGAFFKHLGPGKDISAPDVNTDARVMDWMNDEYSKIAGRKTYAFTGKSVGNGGSAGREVSTSYGGFVVLKRYLDLLGQRRGTVAVQGFGKVGANIAKFLFEDGFKVVAVSDSKGGIYNQGGINIVEVLARFRQSFGGQARLDSARQANRPRALAEIAQDFGYEIIPNSELLELPVSALIPAAVEGVITESNASQIGAKIILEMANGPVTTDAEPILEERGITIIPDIMANAGGVVGSYLEMLQNESGSYWSEEKVLHELEGKVSEAWEALEETRKEHNLSYRQAAFVRAIDRIAKAL